MIKRQTIRAVAVRSTNLLEYQKIILLLVVATLLLLLTRVYFSNQLAVSGSRVGYSESKLAGLEQERFELENKLSQKASLSYIEKEAKKMGLKPVGNVQVLKGAPQVALNQ